MQITYDKGPYHLTITEKRAIKAIFASGKPVGYYYKIGRKTYYLVHTPKGWQVTIHENHSQTDYRTVYFHIN